MTTYHLMIEEDEPVCGKHTAPLTYRPDVADCPECFRSEVSRLEAEVGGLTRERDEHFTARVAAEAKPAAQAQGARR